MARYGKRFKENAVARLLPPENGTLDAVARDVGIGAWTLARWREELQVSSVPTRAWTAQARLDGLITVAGLDEVGKGAWCREHGVFPADLDTWRALAAAALGAPEGKRITPQAASDRQRIKELERNLLRKDRALAETAALLVLSKKAAAIFNQAEDA